MSENNARPRLHPIQWLAALSVVGFSAVGIAAVSGLIPSAGSHQELRSESRMTAAEASTALAADKSSKPAPKVERVAPAPAPAPKSVACEQCGVVESVTPVQVDGQGSGAGVVAGGVVGGVLGNRVGKGLGRDLATIGGAVLGGIAGNQIEKKVKGGTVYDVSVRLDDGQRQILRVEGLPDLRPGDRVALRDGRLQPLSSGEG